MNRPLTPPLVVDRVVAGPTVFVANEREVFRGNELAPDEAVIWRGAPHWRGVARHVFHLRGATAYFAALLLLDAAQAWAKHIAPARALHDSVPLAVITAAALAILLALAWLSARTTRYTITDRRVILQYGIAMPATLSLPFAQISSAALVVRRDHSGDIALGLKAGNRMPFVKLWPLARPWHFSEPQPTLRLVPRAGVVVGLLVRALQVAEQKRHAAPALPGRPALDLRAAVEHPVRLSA